MNKSFSQELILMVGASGSGKSFYSKKMELEIVNCVRLSSDELRGLIGKDESDQTVSGVVFATMRTMTEYFLKNGKTVIIDATNYNLKSRKEFLDIARKFKVRTSAYVCQQPIEVLKKRNAARSRVVPDFVIEKQVNGFFMPTVGEFDDVTEINQNSLI